MTFPTFLIPRQYVWLHELSHATAGIVMGWEPLAITASGTNGVCWFAHHPIKIIRAAPYLVMHEHGLDEDYDVKEFMSAYPDGECDHPLRHALVDKVYFTALWRAVKRHWRSNLLLYPGKCPYVAEASRILANMYSVMGK